MGNIVGEFLDSVFGTDHTTEVHEDGSTTDRYENLNTSVTYNSDGTLRENNYPEQQLPGSSKNWKVTEDSDRNVVNVQNTND
jgi:hypothetical protein